MKKPLLVLIGLLLAIRTLEADCANSMTTVNDLSGFTIVTNDKGAQANATVGFCEDSDYIIDIFYLATDNNSGATYLFVHELVLTNANSGAFSTSTQFVDVPGWQRTNEDLKGWKAIHIGQYNRCGQHGDFTRSVRTGSGVEGRTGVERRKKAKRNLGATAEIDICFHRRDQNDSTVIKYDNQ